LIAVYLPKQLTLPQQDIQSKWVFEAGQMQAPSLLVVPGSMFQGIEQAKVQLQRQVG
jgi:hypothetical protein